MDQRDARVMGGILMSMIGGIQRSVKGYVGDVDERIMWQARET
jgi:hypothetical protein